MKNIFVYCEITEEHLIADVSLELLSKGKKLVDELHVGLEAVLIGSDLKKAIEQLHYYGVSVIHYAENENLFPYRTLVHAKLVQTLFEQEQPEIALFGATSVGRDLAPRIASALRCGLTADCTSLQIGDHVDERKKETYKNLLYQIRPAFGGNIIATIINPETRPQMATVREGVMKHEPQPVKNTPELKKMNVGVLTSIEEVVTIIHRHIEPPKINLKSAQILIAGGYGMGSKENFAILYELADLLGAEVGGTRAAVDAGFCGHERQIGQTGITVRPKLYIACGISGAVQHRAGMDQSAKIISINTSAQAPINAIADYVVVGDVMKVIPQMIQSYKKQIR
jgi:electron transfer flavoprotein alpha subunit